MDEMIDGFEQPRMHQVAPKTYVYGQRMYVLRRGRLGGMTQSVSEAFVPTEVTLTNGRKAILVIDDAQKTQRARV